MLNDLKAFFPATFELAFFAFLLAVIMEVSPGVISAINRNKLVDHISRVISLPGVSTPLFWSALLLQFVFYYKLGWLPSVGRSSIEIHRFTGFILLDSVLNLNWAALSDALKRLILPAVTLAFYSMGYLVRITRESMLEVLESEYVAMAKAKCLPQRIIYYRHALKNAVIPRLLGFNLLGDGIRDALDPKLRRITEVKWKEKISS